MPQLRRKAALLTAATALTGLAAAPPAAYADEAPNELGINGSGECTFPMKQQIEGIPWPLQRVLLDELWQDTKGKGVRVAVIDTGVDNDNVQLKSAVDVSAGRDLLKPDKESSSDDKRGKTDGTVDEVGHGTKVAGIIAARPRKGTGFVGLAPEATIIPIRQNDENNSGNDRTMATAIDHAVAKGADVINISQDTVKPLAYVSRWPGVHDARVQDGHAEFSVDPGELNHVLGHLVDLEVRTMVTSPPTLEELFMRHYDEDITGPGAGSAAKVARAR